MLIRAYLDVTQSSQTLSELKDSLEIFARKKGHRIEGFYNDHEAPAARSSLFRLLRSKGLAIASLDRGASHSAADSKAELFRLLNETRPNDVLLIESVRSLGGLSPGDWPRFRQKTKAKKVRLVSLDVESSWAMASSESAMATMAEQLTGMMLDMLEALALKENSAHRNRHLKGIANAKAQGKYKGRPVNRRKHDTIRALLQKGYSWSEVCAETGASRSTVARVVKSEH